MEIVYVENKTGKVITDLRTVELTSEQVRVAVEYVEGVATEEVLDSIPFGIYSHKNNHKILIKENNKVVKEYMATDLADFLEENLQKKILSYDDIKYIDSTLIIEIKEMLEEVFSDMIIDADVTIELHGINFKDRVIKYDVQIPSRKINIDLELYCNEYGTIKRVDSWI